MTLSKQLLILISVIFLVIFSVNFINSVNNIRDYLEIESEIHAQDTATSLGLSLSPYIADETDPILETMMNAIFDMGYYKEIKLFNAEHKPLVTLNNDKVFAQIPTWFIKLLPMKTARAKTEVSSGWSIGGELYVTVNPGYAYLTLYEQARSSLYYSLAAFAISIVLLFLILRFILLPLKKIEALARTIAEGQFATIGKLPWTTEARNVAVAMNFMSKKIEKVISNLNNRLENISLSLQLDDLTGLHKRGTFITDLKHLFMDNAAGYVFSVKLDKLNEMAKRFGGNKVDRFLIDFANLLKEFSTQSTAFTIHIYRFYGSEFALTVLTSSQEEVTALASNLSNKISNLAGDYQLHDIAHIGIAPFNAISSTDEILAAAREAYEQARLVGSNSYVIRSQDNQAKNMEAWRNLAIRIISNNEYRITYIGQTLDLQKPGKINALVMEEAFTQVVDENNRPIPIGTFISVAEKLGRVIDLDQGVTDKVIAHILEHDIKHPILINLSLQAVKSNAFQTWLSSRLKQHPLVAQNLVFSLTAYTAAKDTQNFKAFICSIHELGARVIVKRYETQFISLEAIKEFKPDYIRLARDLTTNISTNPGKQAFLETMKQLGDLLEIKILAENVSAEADYEIVKATGIFGASR